MQFTSAQALFLASAMTGVSGIANASLITHLDSYGVEWTLSSDGIDYGSSSSPVFKVSVLADTTGFNASHAGTDFDYNNAYINTVSILAGLGPTSGAVNGPAGGWTNLLGGQNSKGCDGHGAHYDCAYYTAGGNPIAGPGVLMNFNGGQLEWDFSLGFAAGTTIDQALSFATDGSHLKVDYYGYTYSHKSSTDVYNFLGQISDDVTVNTFIPPSCIECSSTIPEPETLALLGIGLLGMGIRRKTRSA